MHEAFQQPKTKDRSLTNVYVFDNPKALSGDYLD